MVNWLGRILAVGLVSWALVMWPPSELVTYMLLLLGPAVLWLWIEPRSPSDASRN